MCRSPVEPRVCVAGDHHGNWLRGQCSSGMVPEMTRTSGLGPEGRVCYQHSPEMVDQSPNGDAGNRGRGEQHTMIHQSLVLGTCTRAQQRLPGYPGTNL